MWVAVRSRNQRSWLMMRAQPAKASSASSSAPQGVHVEVVGRLVEQQHVGAGLQHLGQVHPVALAAGELADLLLLIRAPEVEGCPRRPASWTLALAELDHVEPPEISSQTVLSAARVSRDWST